MGGIDRAIPIGLIVNELVTNAVKYAFPGESSGTVTVVLKREPGELRLTVADDGKGNHAYGCTLAAALPLDLAAELLGETFDQAAAEPGIGTSGIDSAVA